MSDVWNINEQIPIEIFVANPVTGGGLAGLVSNITLSIQRNSDGRYWDGLSWQSYFSSVSALEVDSINQRGRYKYTLPGSANLIADKYSAHVMVNYPPLLNNVDNYELYVSRDLNVTLYESEPE